VLHAKADVAQGADGDALFGEGRDLLSAQGLLGVANDHLVAVNEENADPVLLLEGLLNDGWGSARCFEECLTQGNWLREAPDAFLGGAFALGPQEVNRCCTGEEEREENRQAEAKDQPAAESSGKEAEDGFLKEASQAGDLTFS